MRLRPVRGLQVNADDVNSLNVSWQPPDVIAETYHDLIRYEVICWSEVDPTDIRSYEVLAKLHM